MRLKSFSEFLIETTLSRLWQIFDTSEGQGSILSASREEYSVEENRQRTYQLASRIRSDGFGYVFVDGRWVETGPQGEELPVEETSVVVNAKGAPSDIFLQHVISWQDEFEQQGILYKLTGDRTVYARSANGEVSSVGAFRPDRLGAMMTRLRGRGNRTFVFESCYTGMNFVERVASKKR